MPELNCFHQYRMCCNTEFYCVVKIPRIGIGCLSLQRCMVLNGFYRTSAHWRVILIYQFCPSVCPSLTSRYWMKTAYHIVTVFLPYGSPIILVLLASNIFTKFRRGYPCRGAKYRWGIKISRFSTNKSLYLANDTKYRYRYYGWRIGTHMRSIKWCHFQWHWMNPNPVFKVTPLFDAKYLADGYRYGHSYYRRRIGNHTQAFEWHQFQWPWVISNLSFKVMILLNVK